MNNLHLSKEAQNDLAEIKAYIMEELENPDAALAAVVHASVAGQAVRNAPDLHPAGKPVGMFLAECEKAGGDGELLIQ